MADIRNFPDNDIRLFEDLESFIRRYTPACNVLHRIRYTFFEQKNEILSLRQKLKKLETFEQMVNEPIMQCQGQLLILKI